MESVGITLHKACCVDGEKKNELIFGERVIEKKQIIM
jgi:hypothetical protein